MTTHTPTETASVAAKTIDAEPQGYDAAAVDYDRIIRPRYEAIAALVVERARELTDLRRAEVVELSAGTGALTHQLAPLVGRYVASDVSEPMMREARRHDVPGTERVTWVRADVNDLCLPTASADVLVSSLGPFQDSGRGLAEARRVLRPGGLLVAVTWGDDYRELDVLQAARARLGVEPRPTLAASELRVRLQRAGFLDVVVREARLPVVHPSVDAYLTYRQAFGPAPAADRDAADSLLALAASAEPYTDRTGRVVLDWHLLVMSATA